ncbi:hypothetical protein [Azospirillum griseum]|uniref:Uncharacterized protein n=1 Tax=Azospirillum griseum TaxID=2496639 RepID=A0A431VCG0_9PROT|nr:hypothetical protein [Azospirillum griseum]RTR16167.1 hypothetical protein EJ903_21470 [Azospirillum griseum]
MSTLPLSVGQHRFDPIANEGRKRREMLAVAEQKVDESAAGLTVARKAADAAEEAATKAKAELEDLLALNTDTAQDKAVIAAAQATADTAAESATKAKAEADAKTQELKTAQELIETLRKALEQIEADAQKRTLRPVYILRVPNFRLQAQFDQCYFDVPVAPSDRKLWLAMKAVVQSRGAEYGVTADSPDFQALDKAFRESGNAKVPTAAIPLFEDLFTQTCEAEEVRKVLKQRKAHSSGITMLRLRFYVAGLEGLPGAETFAVQRGASGDAELATEESIALIPPSDIDAILAKLDELATTRGREGNS